MSHGTGHRRGLDLALLWWWHRPAATAVIRPLAWEPPNAASVALKKKKDKKKKKDCIILRFKNFDGLLLCVYSCNIFVVLNFSLIYNVFVTCNSF